MAMLPNIPVPEKFDLLPEEYLVKEITDAKAASVNPLIIAALEQQLAAKKFYNDPKLAGNVKLFFDLNPLPGISIDEKIVLRSSNLITEEDSIISTYLAQFIKRALREDEDFATKPYEIQIALLQKYAQEKIAINDVASQIINQQTEKQKVLDEMAAAAKP